jgi:CheY-like chemotaxis protein
MMSDQQSQEPFDPAREVFRGVQNRLSVDRHARYRQGPSSGRIAMTEQPRKARAKRILVMDDEMTIRNLVCNLVRMRGHLCCEAADGREAIERFRKARQNGAPFDLVLMDLSIPGGMGGVQAVRELLQIEPSAHVIVTSGSGADPILSNYAHYGFCGVLNKPFRISELQNLIETC